MKKGLNIFLIALEIILALLAVFAVYVIIWSIYDLNADHDFTEGIEVAVHLIVGRGILIAAATVFVHDLLMTAALHDVRKSIGNKANRPVKLVAVSLVSCIAAILFCLAFFAFRIRKTWVGWFGFNVLWVICLITCILSLIAVRVANFKTKRMLKAAESQGEPADKSKIRLGGDMQ